MSKTRRTVRRVPESLPEEGRGFDPVHNEVFSADPDAQPSAVITAGPDGVPTMVSNPAARVESGVEMRAVDRARDLDALTSMQLGLATLIRPIVFTRTNLKELVDSGDVQSDDFTLQRILFDWPAQEEDVEPSPSALIWCPDRRRYDRDGLQGVELIEDTLDVYGENTILRKLSNVSCVLELTIWCAHKEERRGIIAALERELLAEPGDERPGRRIPVVHHYDRIARFDLLSAEYGDSAEGAQRNKWTVQAQVEADIDRVVLVPTPGFVDPRLAFETS